MKKLKMNRILLILVMIMPIIVLADAGPPGIASYEIIVTNKNGAYCYDSDNSSSKTIYKKTNKVIPFGTVYTIYHESFDNYISLYGEDCEYLSVKDVKPKTDKFSVNQEEVEKITPVKAVILAKGGLNMRKGPSIAYDRVTTIPQHSVVTLKYAAGSFWYYAEYQGKSGWITGINQYFGMDSDEILYSYKSIELYDSSTQKKIVIPPLTEITDYIVFICGNYDSSSFNTEIAYYINYKGVKAYVGGIWDRIPYKTDGQIKLLKDANLYDINGKVIKTLKKGQVLNYTIADSEERDDTDDIEFWFIYYIPSENGYVKLLDNDDQKEYEIVKLGEPIKKTRGYIGEGLFGEKKTSGNTLPTETLEPISNPTSEPIQNPNNEKTPKEKNNELIIICVLGSIILALTIIVIILLINRKKSKKESVVVKETVVNNDNKILETKEEKVTEEKSEENDKTKNE